MKLNGTTIKKQKLIYRNVSRNPNIVDLLRKSRLEEKKGKRQNYIIAAAAVSALVISGYIISQ